MSLKLFLILYLLNNYNALCNEGCLKCNKNQQCQICDVSKFMKLRNGKCEQVNEELCIKIQLDGTCLTCKDNYFVDPTTKKCTAVEENYLIDNCILYGEQQECLLCQNEYYTLNGKCVKVSIKISNCQIYLNDTTCSQCEPNFLLSLNGKTCSAKPSAANCQDFSTVECVKCSKNFIVNKNIYQKQIFSINSEFEIDYLLAWKFSNQGLLLQQDNMCQKQVVENCQIVEDFDSCKKCNDGFYLTDSKFCLPYPYSIILNCEVYSSATVCGKCFNKYYKKNSNTCLPVTLVENCSIYGQTENDQGCKQCEPNFYLDSNKCKPRENDVKNCQEYEIIDRCKSCGPGFILTNDRLKCLPSILFCNNYEASSKDTISLTCLGCQDGYFLKSNNCQQGSNVNCAKYTQSSTLENQQCAECVNKFYLSNGNCLEIGTIPNCSNYHKSKDKSCLKCEGLFFNFQLENKCEIFSEIANCIQYQKVGDTINCTKCADKFYLDTNQNICMDISVTHPFCNKANAQNDQCIECQSYKILVNGKCIDNMPYNTQFCETVKDDQLLSNATCQVCKESSYPKHFNTVSTCLTQEELGVTLQVDKSLCKIYNDDGTCKICKSDYVQNDGDCVTACPAGKYMIKHKGDKINYCVTEDGDYESGCDIMTSYKIGTTLRLICAKCKQNYLPYLEDSSTQEYYGNAFDNNLNFMQNILTRNIGVQCVQLTSSILLNDAPNTNGQPPIPDPNCLIWIHKTNNSYYCQRCVDFHTFSIVNGKPSACTLDSQFNLQKIYTQNKDILRFVSGYQCVDRSLSVLVQYDNSNIIVNTKSNLQNKSNQCVSKQQINDEFNNRYVENCAVYISQDDFLDCYECFPGYKLSYSDQLCTPIEHCDGFLWFSACSKCQKGYAYEKVNNTIDYAKCKGMYIATVDDNCLSVSGNVGLCDFCKKGYLLNVEQSCEKILFPKCSSTEFFNYTDISINDMPYEYYLYYGSYIQGCNTCLEGYVPVSKNINTTVCIFSYFLRDFAHSEELSYLRTHCKKYQGQLGQDDDIFCEECYKGKLVNKNNRFCLDEIPNCKILENSTLCQTCISNQFANINGECKQLEIEHCLEYDVESIRFEQCKTCKDGYYAEGKLCLKTEVLNCIKPTSKTECDQCAENFYLVELSEDRDYCLPQSIQVNCNKANIVTDGEYGGKLTCTQCSLPNSYIVTQDTNPQLFQTFTECIRVEPIENCGELNFPQVLASDSFACNQCVGNYFLSDSSLSCSTRNNLSMNCEIFDPNNDKCMTCNNTSYLVDDGKDCQTFPDGLVGCKKYLYRYTCEVCHAGFYLVDGDCKQIPEANLIANCEIYKSEKECEKCVSKFFVSENTCVEVKVSNCKVLQDQNTCQECISGYGLAIRGNNIDCELISKNRCLIFDQTKPYPCLVCNEGFYPDETGECIESKPKIEFCIQQESQEKCIKCQKGSVLSKDQTKCYKTLQYTSKIPFDCEQSVEKEPFCTSCQPGYKFNSEGLSCVLCNAVQNNNGCAVCDPLDDNKCFMCKSGYQQDQDGNCIIQSNDTNEPVIDNVNGIKTIFVVEFLMMICLLIF